MKVLSRAAAAAAVAAVALSPAAAVEWRTLEEVKSFVMERAGKRGAFAEVKADEVRKILDNIKTLDRDEWAREWCKVGLAYEAKGDELEKKGAPGKEIADTFHHGFHYCMLARYPAPTSPGKLEAYHHSMRLFRKAAKHFDPPLRIDERQIGRRRMAVDNPNLASQRLQNSSHPQFAAQRVTIGSNMAGQQNASMFLHQLQKVGPSNRHDLQNLR